MDCKKQCSGHCINNEPCDYISGVCHSGCQDGYIGNNCNICKKQSVITHVSLTNKHDRDQRFDDSRYCNDVEKNNEQSFIRSYNTSIVKRV